MPRSSKVRSPRASTASTGGSLDEVLAAAAGGAHRCQALRPSARATLPAEVPLHARPAGDFVRAAAQFPAEISRRREREARPTPRASSRSWRWARSEGPSSSSRRQVTAPPRPPTTWRVSCRSSADRSRPARASASRADDAASARRAASAASANESRRTVSRSSSRRAGATLSSSTPSPIRSVATAGSPAASPHTSTVLPAACAASTTWATRPRTIGLGRGRGGGDRPVAVEAERVLHEVVRPDREEVGLGRDLGGARRPLRASRSSRRRRRRAGDECAHRPHLLCRLDEREQDAQPCSLAGPDDRAQLVLEAPRDGRASASGRGRLIPARNGGVLSAPKSSVRTVATRPRSRASAGASAATCSSSLGQRARREEGQLRAQEPDALGARLETRRHLGRGGGVAEQRHGAAVAGDRRKPARCDSLLAQRPATSNLALGASASRLALGSTRDRAAVSVDDQRLAAPDREHVLAEADRHRHAERARHDRRVGGGRPFGQRDRRAPGLPRGGGRRRPPGPGRARRGSTARSPRAARAPASARTARRPSWRTSVARAASSGSGSRASASA